MTTASDERRPLGRCARPGGAGEAEGLQRAPDAVVQVRAEHGHRDQVDQRQPPGRRTCRPAGCRGRWSHRPATLTLPMVKFSRCQMMNSSRVTPPQRISRLAKSAPVCFLTTYLIGAGPARAAPERDGGVHVHDQGDDQHRADDPEQPGVGQHRLADGAQVLGVLVVGVVAGEGLEVAVHVQQHEADEDEAADGHQQLQRDGRARSHAAPLTESLRLPRTATRIATATASAPARAM